MERIYLSRRNLLTLLAKLDAARGGADTECTLVKRDTIHPLYPCTNECEVVALEDADYYTDRPAGAVHPREERILREKND